jgi:hypothetical protein
MYKQKLKTPEQAVMLVKDGDWVDYGMTTSQRYCSIRHWRAAKMSYTILKYGKPCPCFPVRSANATPVVIPLRS